MKKLRTGKIICGSVLFFLFFYTLAINPHQVFASDCTSYRYVPGKWVSTEYLGSCINVTCYNCRRYGGDSYAVCSANRKECGLYKWNYSDGQSQTFSICGEYYDDATGYECGCSSTGQQNFCSSCGSCGGDGGDIGNSGNSHVNPVCISLMPHEISFEEQFSYLSYSKPAVGVGAAAQNTLKYQWFAYPNGGTGMANSSSWTTPLTNFNLCWNQHSPYKSQLTCDYNNISTKWGLSKADKPLAAEFSAPAGGGRLDAVEIAITGSDQVYLAIMVVDNAGKILTDNDGYNGGKECWLSDHACAPVRFESSYSWYKYTFKIKPYLTGGQKYRIIAKRRGGDESKELKWYKNARNAPGHLSNTDVYQNYGYLFKTYLLNTPSSGGSFSPTIGNGTTTGITTWTPPAGMVGKSFSIVAQVVDGTSYPGGDFGGGICPISTAIIK